MFKKFVIKGEKIKGKGTDEVGPFKIKGKLHKDGGVTFKKEYHGHKVEYDGKLDNNSKKIRGEWSLDYMRGDFEIYVRI